MPVRRGQNAARWMARRPTALISRSDNKLSDKTLLDGLLARLKSAGEIEYTGEYGPEITTFIPLVNWLEHEGLLDGRRVLTYRGMRPYYFFLSDDQFAPKDEPRLWVPPHDRLWPTNSTFTATRKPWHIPPDYRAFYGKKARTFSRPVLFIQNKFAVEWGIGPINFLPLDSLESILAVASDRFQIVFSRPRASRENSDYSNDHNDYCDYPDLNLVRRTPGALILEEVAAAEQRPYNEVKLEFLAGTHLFLAVQGGGAQILAAFGNSLLAILHRQGGEYPHAYRDGAYKYLSDSPPELLVARSNSQLCFVIEIIASAKIADGHVSSELATSRRYAKMRM